MGVATQILLTNNTPAHFQPSSVLDPPSVVSSESPSPVHTFYLALGLFTQRSLVP
jgi:hypothetical protein